jgi:hypothetical protein
MDVQHSTTVQGQQPLELLVQLWYLNTTAILDDATVYHDAIAAEPCSGTMCLPLEGLWHRPGGKSRIPDVPVPSATQRMESFPVHIA